MQIDKNELTPEQVEMEGSLRRLVPAAAAIDRDALIFAAGEAAGRAGVQGQSVWPWKVAACVGFALGALSLTVAIREGHLNGTPVVESVEKFATPAPSADIPEHATHFRSFGLASAGSDPVELGQSPWSYHSSLNAVLVRGVDAIPSAPNGEANPDQGRALRGESPGRRPSFTFFQEAGHDIRFN